MGKRVDKKILVIESDDWGSTRMPSRQVYEKLLKSNIRVGACAYSRNDSLENVNDLQALAETLSSVKDRCGNSAKITMNFLSANPDFDAIQRDSYEVYHTEPLQLTYRRYGYQTKDVLEQGIIANLFHPEFHGREHLNVPMWLTLLQKNREVRMAAEHGIFQLSFANLKSIQFPFLASFYPFGQDYLNEHARVIKDGIDLFNGFFRRMPQSFIAPVYIWHDGIDSALAGTSIKSIQGLYKRDKYIGGARTTKVLRTTRQKTEFGHVNVVRNCFFEPSTKATKDWLDSALHEIAIAFQMKKPAVICSHRLNYVGSISPKNRDENNKKLMRLLTDVTKRWPDVEFMSSAELSGYLVS